MADDVVVLQAAKADAKKKYTPRAPKFWVPGGVGNEVVKARLTNGLLDTAILAASNPVAGSSANPITGAQVVPITDPRLRISGSPFAQFSGAQDGGSHYAPRTSTRVDGSYSGATRMVSVEFDSDDDRFAFSTMATADSAWNFWVDDKPWTAAPTQLSAVSGMGGGSLNTFRWVRVAFLTRARRRIRIELIGSPSGSYPSGVYLDSIALRPTATLTYPAVPSPRMMFMGDSQFSGLGPTTRGLSLPKVTAWSLGIADWWDLPSVPSTGFVQTNTSITPNAGNYGSRFTNDVKPYQPDICIVQASINDGTSWPALQGQITPAAAALLTRFKKELPDTTVIMCGPLRFRVPTAADYLVRDESLAAANAAGIPYLDTMSLTHPYFTGTGHVGATVGDGNADYYCETTSPYIHASDEGTVWFGRMLAGMLAPYLLKTVA